MDGPQVSKMGQIKKMNDHYYTNKVVFDLIKRLHLFIKARAETEKKIRWLLGKLRPRKIALTSIIHFPLEFSNPV